MCILQNNGDAHCRNCYLVLSIQSKVRVQASKITCICRNDTGAYVALKKDIINDPHTECFRVKV